MSAAPAGWEAVIGLEIHAQLKTESKIFCACAARFGGEPNTRTCPVCLGLPGALPVLNRRVVDYAIRVGLAMNCDIAPQNYLARKNYFYPDLPKGYQITQYAAPLCEGGGLVIGRGRTARLVRLRRIHVEEDAGKSFHGDDGTRVDLNRSGVPLIEIVTEPDLRDPAAAHEFLLRLRRILTYLEVCDGNMEEGSLRCDANVSLRRAGERELGVKTELKNLNSFRGVEAALAFEIARQGGHLAAGGRVVPETRLWDAAARRTLPMRGKESSPDYRYFPEPDLPPLEIDLAWLGKQHAAIPELPEARRRRFESELGLNAADADRLTESRPLADYFEAAAAAAGDAVLAANWVLVEVLRLLKSAGGRLVAFPVSGEALGDLLARLRAGELGREGARTVLERMTAEGGEAAAWIRALGLDRAVSGGALAALVDEALAAHPREAARYRAGETKLLAFLMGTVMRAAAGRADPAEAKRILRRKLGGGAAAD